MRDEETFGQSANQNGKAPLFRQEAIAYLINRQYGTVLLTYPLSHKILSIWFTLIALAIILFFFRFETTSKTVCQGLLQPSAGLLRVVAMQSGIVGQSKVKEGQRVKAGDVLFILSGERNSESAGLTQLGITRLLERRRSSFDVELEKSQINSKHKLAAAKEKTVLLAGEQNYLEEQSRLQQSRVKLAEQSLRRYSDLQAQNYVSAALLQDKQAELLDQRQRLADIFRLLSSARRSLAETHDDVRELQFQASRETEALRRDADALKQELLENEARREILILAPTDGIIGAVAAVAGQTVNTGATLASLVPSDSLLEAEVYAPSRAIGFIRPGMQVLLRYQAYPYQKFGQYEAVVSDVASAALTPQELALPAVAGKPAESLYRIRLKLRSQTVQAYGERIPLKSGMLVDASVVLEHRKLYEWVLEPMFSISGRI